MSNPYRDHTPQETPAPATPTLWKLRVWWASLFVESASGGDQWRLVYWDENNLRQSCCIDWGNCENIAERCENTPAGEPAPMRTGDQAVVFIHPTNVPTVARLARQAANALKRLTPAP